jgi:hypothetical protein
LVCGKHNCQQVSRNFYCADGERREKWTEEAKN